MISNIRLQNNLRRQQQSSQNSSNLFVQGHDVRAIGKFNGTPMAKDIKKNTGNTNLADALKSYHETTLSTQGTQEAIFVGLNESKIGREEAILREALGPNIKPDSDLAKTFLDFHNKENMKNKYYSSIVQLPGKEVINGKTVYTFHSYDKDIKKGKTLYFDENGKRCLDPYQTTTQPKVQPTPNHVNTPSNTQTPTSTSRPQTTNTIDTTAPTAATETQTTDSVSTTTQPQTSSNLFVKGHDVKAIGKFNGTPMAKEIEENTEEPNLAKALESYHETTFSTKGTQEAIFVRLNDSKIGSEEAILREALGSNIKPDSDLAETFLAFHNKENMQNEYYESIVQLPGKENINGRTFYTFHSYDKDIKKGKTLYFDENGNKYYTQEEIKAIRENAPRLYFSEETTFTPEDMEEIVNLYLNNVDFSTLNDDERAMLLDLSQKLNTNNAASSSEKINTLVSNIYNNPTLLGYSKYDNCRTSTPDNQHAQTRCEWGKITELQNETSSTNNTDEIFTLTLDVPVTDNNMDNIFKRVTR